MKYIFEHGRKADKEIQFFDTAGLLARRETFLARLQDEVINGDADPEFAIHFVSRIFKAMRTAERLAFLEDQRISLMMERWNTSYQTAV